MRFSLITTRELQFERGYAKIECVITLNTSPKQVPKMQFIKASKAMTHSCQPISAHMNIVMLLELQWLAVTVHSQMITLTFTKF